MPSKNYLKENYNSCCYVIPPKSDASWAYTNFFPNNSKDTDHRHIPLTRADHYNRKLFKKYLVLNRHVLTFSNISVNLQENQSAKYRYIICIISFIFYIYIYIYIYILYISNMSINIIYISQQNH